MTRYSILANTVFAENAFSVLPLGKATRTFAGRCRSRVKSLLLKSISGKPVIFFQPSFLYPLRKMAAEKWLQN